MQEKPELRPSFKDIYIRNIYLQNLDKLKFHIFVQDHSIDELQKCNKFMKMMRIIDEIYKTLDDFFICEVGPKAESFKMKSSKNLEIIHKMAKLNHPKALLFIGIFYEWGINVSFNKEKALGYYLRCIQLLEEPYALYRFGYLSTDKNTIFSYYLRAANTGNSYGIFQLGMLYKYGIGCLKNENKCYDLIDKSANLGNALGNFKLFIFAFNQITMKECMHLDIIYRKVLDVLLIIKSQ